MKTHVILIHGIRKVDSLECMQRLRPFFIARKKNPIIHDYGHLGILTRFQNKRLAKELADKINSLDGRVIVVAHSNGCAITHLAASLYNAKINKAVYINAALESRVDVPSSIESVDVYHAPSDFTLLLGALRPFHIWGTMGRYGYRGKSTNVTNYNFEMDFVVKNKGHSTLFERDIIEYYGPIIVNNTLQDKVKNHD